MDSLKNWIVIVLTLIFVLFYTAALLGWLKPLSDMTFVMRLEPILFLMVGYYFASLPAQKTQTVLKDEIIHQTKRADAAQHSREQVQQERQMLEEKLKNVRIILMSTTGKSSSKILTENSFKTEREETPESLRCLIKTATNILNS
jgi:hypothetical protein